MRYQIKEKMAGERKRQREGSLTLDSANRSASNQVRAY
jgi:hypothetical protein